MGKSLKNKVISGEIQMASKEKSWKDNEEGPWYVDDCCILCGLCVDLAPLHFKESDSGDHMIVFKQPLNMCNVISQFFFPILLFNKLNCRIISLFQIDASCFQCFI